MMSEYTINTLRIGIDPGLGGSAAVLDCAGVLIALYDTPTLILKVRRGTKREYDVPGMVQILRPYAEHSVHAIIEESQAMPKQGVVSTFTTGVGFGIWLGVLATLRIAYTRVRPATWKKTMSLQGKDKEASRLRAQQLFPRADLRRKKDHGKAEALLLARYGLSEQAKARDEIIY